MKILFINAFYKEASTGKIVYDIMSHLEANTTYEMYACYGRGKKQEGHNIYRICSELYAKIGIAKGILTGRYYAGQKMATKRLLKYIEQLQPDIIHLHCMNSYVMNIYEVLDYIKKKRYKTILTLHAEFMYTGTCGYSYECEKWKERKGCYDCTQTQKKWLPLIDSSRLNWNDMVKCFEGFDNLLLTSVSPWLRERAKESYILGKYENITILNGINTKVFRYYNNYDVNKKKKIILHVTANFEAQVKGGTVVREIAKKYLNAKNDTIEIIVVGKTNNKDIPDNITTMGPIYDQTELAKLYSLADLTLLTSEKETFSMVCAESLCCGTPVVGFEAGAPEQISLRAYSRFVEQGNMDLLMEMIDEWLGKTIDKKKISSEAIGIYSSATMAKEYQKLYEYMMRKDLDD